MVTHTRVDYDKRSINHLLSISEDMKLNNFEAKYHAWSGSTLVILGVLTILLVVVTSYYLRQRRHDQVLKSQAFEKHQC